MERRGRHLSRRAFVVGAGAAGLLAGCERPRWQAQGPPAPKLPRVGLLVTGELMQPFKVRSYKECANMVTSTAKTSLLTFTPKMGRRTGSPIWRQSW